MGPTLASSSVPRLPGPTVPFLRSRDMRAILRKLSGWAMVLLGGACAGGETQVVEGALVVVPADLDFRGVAAGAEASRTIEVRNTGGRSLALQATSPTDFFVDPPFLRLDARKAT